MTLNILKCQRNHYMRRRLIDLANRRPSPIVGALVLAFTTELTCALGLLIAWLLGWHR